MTARSNRSGSYPEAQRGSSRKGMGRRRDQRRKGGCVSPWRSWEKIPKLKKDGISLKFDPASGLATATDKDGKELPTVTVFWFAWQAFYPQTALWKP